MTRWRGAESRAGVGAGCGCNGGARRSQGSSWNPLEVAPADMDGFDARADGVVERWTVESAAELLATPTWEFGRDVRHTDLERVVAGPRPRFDERLVRPVPDGHWIRRGCNRSRRV